MNKMTLMYEVMNCIVQHTDEIIYKDYDSLKVNENIICNFVDPDKCIITVKNSDLTHEITGSASEIASEIVEVSFRNPNPDFEYCKQVSQKLHVLGVEHNSTRFSVSYYGLDVRGTRIYIHGKWKETDFTVDEMVEFFKNHVEKGSRFMKELDRALKQSGFTLRDYDLYEKMEGLFEIELHHDWPASVCRVRNLRVSDGAPDVMDNYESLTPEEIVARINSYLSQ